MSSLPRKQSVTAQDVAHRAGVSRAVVSRALSNNGSISPDTRERVLRAAEELGYQVNFLAQGLNRRRSHLIGVMVSRISDPFRSSLLDALLGEIQRRGFQALVSEIRSEQDLARTLRRFAQFRVSGVIVTSDSRRKRWSMSAFRSRSRWSASTVSRIFRSWIMSVPIMSVARRSQPGNWSATAADVSAG
jgi:DNA-binding LacI/PurR family transcriptional regulator